MGKIEQHFAHIDSGFCKYFQDEFEKAMISEEPLQNEDHAEGDSLPDLPIETKDALLTTPQIEDGHDDALLGRKSVLAGANEAI